MFSTWTNGLLDGGETFGREYQDEFRRQWQAFSGSGKDYLRARAPGVHHRAAPGPGGQGRVHDQIGKAPVHDGHDQVVGGLRLVSILHGCVFLLLRLRRVRAR